MNNGKYHTDEYKRKQNEKNDRLFGPIDKHIKTCETCGQYFIFEGRVKSKKFEKARFCSRKCANSIGGKAKSEKYITDEIAHYTTLAWRYHDKKCVVCGEQNIVAVHHVNEIHTDNRPENLIPLCPTHHQYMHSKHRYLIEDIVDKYIENKWGISANGNTVALQASIEGSIPSCSTKLGVDIR